MPASSPNQGGLIALYVIRCWICRAQTHPEDDPHSARRRATAEGWHQDRNYPLRPTCPQCHRDGIFAAAETPT